MPSSSETLRAGVTKFGTGGDLDTRYPDKQKKLTPQIKGGQNFDFSKKNNFDHFWTN